MTREELEARQVILNVIQTASDDFFTAQPRALNDETSCHCMHPAWAHALDGSQPCLACSCQRLEFSAPPVKDSGDVA